MLKDLMLKSVTIAVACSISFVAYAMADALRFVNVPAGDLVQGLEFLAKQTDVELVYQAAQLRGLHTHGVTGNLTAHDAVTRLLEGTEIHLRTDQATGAMLIGPPEQGGSGPSGASSRNPSDTATNSGKEGKKDSSDGFRVAQVDQGQTSSPSTVEKQDEQASKKKFVQLEEVVVTGSRIPLAAGQQQVQPVRSYTRDDIDRSGQTTVSDFLNTLPDISLNSDDGVFVGNGAIPGQRAIRLHGLPAGTTLLLLNGRRTDGGFTGFFDLNTIPAAAVERVEILPVGASAIYGADALGGAINIVLRQNLNGFEANAKFDHIAGATNADANFGWGNTWEHGAVTLIGTHQRNGELDGSQREPTSTINFPAGAPTFAYVFDDCSPGNVYSLDGGNLPGLSSPQAGIPAGISGRPTIGQFAPTAGKPNQCNYTQSFAFVPYSQREGALLSAHYHATEAAEFFTEVLFSHQNLENPGGHLIDEFGFLGTILGANNPYNPFGQDVGVSFSDPSRRSRFNASIDLIRPLIGVRGEFFSQWHYEATASFSRDQYRYLQDVGSGQASLQAALNSSDPATALNPFTTGPLGPPQVVQSILATFGPASQGQFTNKALNAQSILRGPLFHLPAGAVDVAIGGEYDHQQEESQFNGAVPGLVNESLHRNAYAAFGEGRLPLLAAGGEPRLTLNVAGRYDHADDIGGKATWQSALRWRANASLSVSAGYGISYRAPTLDQIGGAISSSQPFGLGVGDPFRGDEPVTATLLSGGNPNLKPETGNSRTVEIGYASQAQPAFAASLTWYSINISNYISIPSFQALIDNPTLYPGAVVRAPPTPQDVQQGFLGSITQVSSRNYNFGDLRVAGFDADMSYSISTTLGTLKPSLAIANVYRWESALVPGAPLLSYVSQATSYFSGLGFAPRWKGTAVLAWNRGPLSASLAGRYTGRYKDYQDLVPNSNELGNFWIFDLNARFEAGQALATGNRWLSSAYVAVGAINLFDKGPQFSYGSLPFDPTSYDIRGRSVYVQIGVKW